MNLQQPGLRFLLKSNLFVSFCALGLCLETTCILHQAFREPAYYLFVFFSTICTYNGYYFFSDEFKYYRHLMWVGLAGAMASVFFLKPETYYWLVPVSCLSLLYILPVFIPFKKPVLYKGIRLAILILVWVMMTFSATAGMIHFSADHLLLLVYRIVLMSSLCILFFIRDEQHEPSKQMARASLFVLLLMQIILAILIGFMVDAALGSVYLMASILTSMVSKKTLNQKQTDLYYLFFVDGIMLLQSIFVLLKFYLLA